MMGCNYEGAFRQRNATQDDHPGPSNKGLDKIQQVPFNYYNSINHGSVLGAGTAQRRFGEEFSFEEDCEEFEGEAEQLPLLYDPDSINRASNSTHEQELKRKNIYLVVILIPTIIFGVMNSVSFKIMQYSALNYSIFLSFFVVLAYVVVGFVVIALKSMFTNHISPEQRAIPIYKFMLIAACDSLAGMLLIVGGKNMPGIFQNALKQGAIPVSMLVSLFLLKPRGCNHCKAVYKLLKRNHVDFDIVVSSKYVKCSHVHCACGVKVYGQFIKGADVSLIQEAINYYNTIQDFKPKYVLYSSFVSIKTHLTTYFTIPQYLGGCVISIGLVICVYPQLAYSNVYEDFWPIVALLMATIPTAFSAVLKEVLFKNIRNLDVWYITYFVAVFQLIFNLLWSPLTTRLTGLGITKIFQNIYRGFACFTFGENYITQSTSHCSIESTCKLDCCDSCDGSIPSISTHRALFTVSSFILINIIYNILLVTVIKRGSATLMYVASTLVIPISALCFASHTLMKEHAGEINTSDLVGLGIIIVGIVMYRFLTFKKGTTTGNVYLPTLVGGSSDVATELHEEDASPIPTSPG